MLSAHDNELLTRTAAGTPMGDLFRRFWLPVALSEELPRPDGEPVPVTVLGEELLAFRASDGAVGLVERRCPHRGADLFWGRNEEQGLRCVYHGWKFDLEGRCVDMPSEPGESRFAEKVGIAAYPVREWGGFAWAWMGPGSPAEVPLLEFATLPPEHRYVSKKLQQCNWAQAVEGAIDTAHFSFLHMPVAVPPDAPAPVRWMKQDGSPRFTVLPHDAGFTVGAARRADGDDLYWRITQFLLPNHSLAPGAAPGEDMVGQTWVPIDEQSSWVYCYAWNPDRPIGEDARARYARGFGIFPELGDGYVPVRRRENNYLIDREDQRTRSFTGVKGISEQDACIQDSQGFIADRTREHLGTTDIAIIEFRKLMLGLARDLREGQEPTAARLPEAYALRGGMAIASRTVAFVDLPEAHLRAPAAEGAR